MKSLEAIITLGECIKFEELPAEIKLIIETCRESLKNNESVVFTYCNEEFEIYIADTKEKDYYVIEKSV